MVDNVIYTVTSQDCNGVPNAVWAIDLAVDPPKSQSYALNGGSGWTLGGAAIGGDGTVYVRDGDRLLALRPRDLQLKDYFLLQEKAAENPRANDVMPSASPLVLSVDNRDFVATDCGNGQLCLLDSASLGGASHNVPMFRSSQLAQAARNESGTAERGPWGNLSSWQDSDGSRWVLASVMGPSHPDLKVQSNNGPSTNGFVVGFKVQVRDGKRVLEPSWTSRDLQSPLPPVVANGVVFALSAGEFSRQLQKTPDDLPTIDERPKGSTRATLYGLDARTGKELYSSKNLIPVPAALTGLTVTTGRVYFGGADGSFYVFGMYMEH
jgi:outer membrane protein assembly factor BamB